MTRSLSRCFALLFSLVAMAAGVAVAQEAAPSAVATEPVYDVGLVRKGDPIQHEFEIVNEGDAPLLLIEVKPSCGCTVAKYDATIAPGASGRVSTVIETANFKGPIAKAVNVFTNDPQNPKISLVVKANVKPFVEVSPGYARFTAVEGRAATVPTQTLWSKDRPNVRVLSVESPVPYLSASFEQLESDESGSRWQIALALGKNAPVGPIASKITIQTDHPERPTVELPVAGMVRPLLSVSPPVADFGRREVPTPFNANFEIRNFAEEEIQLLSVVSPIPGLAAEIRSVEEGRRYYLVLTLAPTVAKGNLSGKLRIATSSAERPILEVDVKGTIL